VLRPENIDWVDDSARAGNSGFATFAGVVEDMVRAGSYTRVRIRVGDAVIAMQYTGARRLALAPGETATFGYHVAHLHLIAE
jgi:hypothetical protein